MRNTTKEEKGKVKQLYPKPSEADILKRLQDFSKQLVISEQAADAINRLLLCFDNRREPIMELLDDFFLHYIRGGEYEPPEMETAFYAYSNLQRVVRAIDFVQEPNSPDLKKLYHVEH